MQPIESIALAAFLLMYLLTAFRALVTPMTFRDSELEFYKSGKPGAFLLTTFVLGNLAFALVVVHLVMEEARIGQLILYFQVVLFEIILPFHFMPFFRQRMVSTLAKKTSSQYRSLGWKRIAIATLMVAVPLLYPMFV